MNYSFYCHFRYLKAFIFLTFNYILLKFDLIHLFYLHIYVNYSLHAIIYKEFNCYFIP